MWIPIKDWSEVPIGSKICDILDNGKPSPAWHGGTKISYTIFLGVNGDHFSYHEHGTEGSFGFDGQLEIDLINRYDFRYLFEPEPYDPDQEPEDDCL